MLIDGGLFGTTYSENFILKLKGLDENAYYKDEESGEIYSGALLTQVGLNLSNQINYAYGSKKYFFTKFIKNEFLLEQLISKKMII